MPAGPIAQRQRGLPEQPGEVVLSCAVQSGQEALFVGQVIVHDRLDQVLAGGGESDQQRARVGCRRLAADQPALGERGEPAAWTGVHVWSFDRGRATRFVSYASAEYQRLWTGEHATATG